VSTTTESAAARADALIDAGRAHEAVVIVNQALAHDPDDVDLLGVLARAQLDVDPAGARATAMRLISLRPESPQGYLFGSFAAAATRDRKAAAAFAEHAIAKAPNLGEAHAQLAQALANDRKRRRHARGAAARALELAPHSTLSRIAAGNVELGAGRKRQAAEHYRQALEIDPTNTVAMTNLAIVSKSRWNTGGALGGLQSTLALDPNDPQARRTLDRILHAAIIDLQWLVVGLAAILLAIRG
jgi:tetratricopeptide (TPR) repeat protein